MNQAATPSSVTAAHGSHPGASSEMDLVSLILAGQQSAFAELMRRYNRSLYRAARSILRDDDEAEDAVQEAWLDAFRHLASFRGHSSLATWLTRIAINAALGRRRRQQRRCEVFELVPPEQRDLPGKAEPEPAMDHATPEQEALRSEMRQLLERCIDELPEQFRTVFVLRALEDMPASEVAVVLGVAEATVRSRFFRARGLLREKLARHLDIAEAEAFSFAGERCLRISTRVLEQLAQENLLLPGQ